MNLDPRVIELLDRYLDGALAPGEVAELEAELAASAEARAAFWDRARLHSALRMVAQERRGAKLAREVQPQPRVVATPAKPKRAIAARASGKVVRFPAPVKSTVFGNVLAIAAAIALIAAGAWAWRWYAPVAHVSTTVAATWEGKDWTSGDGLRRDTLKLASGVAEITFLNGARVVLEGPAELAMAGPNGVRLHKGRLSAMAPPSAHGFTVETPTSKVVDLGTRFGVAVEPSTGSQTHVFEGKVHVDRGAQSFPLTAGDALLTSGSTFTRSTADARRFPQTGRVISNLLKNGDFEPETFIGTQSIPQQTGRWDGNLARIKESVDGVTPHTGSGMLSFVMEREQEVGQWQLVDLGAVKEAARGSTVQAAFSVWLNRLPAGSSPGIFTVTLAAFRGSPDRAAELWGKRSQEAVAFDEQTLWADGDPNTWQRLDSSLSVPPEADFLLVCIAAKSQEPVDQQPVVSHFADLASLEVHVPPVPSLSDRTRLSAN